MGGPGADHRQTVHVPDIDACRASSPRPTGSRTSPAGEPRLPRRCCMARTCLACSSVYGFEAGPFSQEQISLLEAFAGQAALAIANAHLFDQVEQRNGELQESNRQVTEALEQQTALAEVLQVLSDSPAD